MENHYTEEVLIKEVLQVEATLKKENAEIISRWGVYLKIILAIFRNELEHIEHLFYK